MRDDPAVVDLVHRAAGGDQAAWDAIVARYAPLVWGICRRHRLSDMDADDVGANVWLRLVERLGTIKEPAALPGWLATTTRNECLQVLRAKRRHVPVENAEFRDEEGPPSDEWLLTQERHIALRAALESLSDRCRHLLTLLFGEPPTPYIAISDSLGMPVGAIGPSRARCLDALRRSPALTSLRDPAPAVGEGRS
ncbi:MAG TPA: sigma-70 family RNA polymerase sigma factor [Actinophytocola sp.]|jgi:RNA polymerase sigma factor (sigma-70 family)|uniref:RNA polymerase sigma factor n=1 Tax=Actinophytocola sp. TaxID=1872138 RepID=UPI002F921713